MTENTESKQTPTENVKNFFRRNERKILVAATIVSTTVAVVTRIGLKQHDEFLKLHGLLDQYYSSDIPTNL